MPQTSSQGCRRGISHFSLIAAIFRQGWQISAEAILPLNHGGGTGPGFRAQLLLFLDDLAPSLFGKPLLSNQPDRSQIAW
jgi:hypothetical protein